VRRAGQHVSFAGTCSSPSRKEIGQDVFDPVRARIRNGRGYIRKMKCDYLAYALIDSIIDHLFSRCSKVSGDAIEELEDQVLERPSRENVVTIHNYKRALMQLRRYVWPGTRSSSPRFLHDDSGLVQRRDQGSSSAIATTTPVRIMDLIEIYRDVNSGLMELYLSAVGMRTNEIMRVLTVMSSIFIPLTFVAGVYG
jgi:magnesium transporter